MTEQSDFDMAAVEAAAAYDQMSKEVGLSAGLICIPGQHRVQLDGSDLVATFTGNLPYGWEAVTADLTNDDEWLMPRAKYNPIATTEVPVCAKHVDCFKRGASCVDY